MKRTLVLAVVLMAMLAFQVNAQNLTAGSLSTFAGTTSGETSGLTAIGGQPVIGRSGTVSAGLWGIVLPLSVISVEEQPGLPLKWEIGTAYPNPFNPSVGFTVQLPVPALLKAEVYNVLGQRVAVLSDRQMPQGVHRLIWNAQGHSSGVYFLRAEVPGQMQRVQRVVLIR